MNHRELLLANLDLVERLVRFVARKHHLSSIDTEEFASIVRLKLVEDNFAILRKFEGRSRLSTYLTIVIDRLCHDVSIARWGKWRPSAAARRLGDLAVLLERLIVRDGASFDEAVATLQTNHGVTGTRAELREMFLALPVRSARWNGQESPCGGGEGFSGPSHADETEAERISLALSLAVSVLPGDDRRILKMRFEENLTVVQIAEMLGTDIRALYRRLHGITRVLRASLEARGVTEADIRPLVGHPTLLLRSVLAELPEARVPLHALTSR